jgi:hypothetical protein
VGALNYALVDCGELFVMITGVTVMPQLHTTSWGFQETMLLEHNIGHPELDQSTWMMFTAVDQNLDY